VNRTLATKVALGAVALVGLAWFLAQGRGTTPERARGSAMLPALKERAEEVGAIEVLRGNSTVRLERNPDGSWIVATSESYPARNELVRALVASMGELAVEERMTAKKDRHGELSLAWPDESGKARLVRFLPKDPLAPIVAEVVVGEERFSPDAVFVRQPDQDQTWRARGRVQLPYEANGWIDRTLLSLPSDETNSVSFAGITVGRPAGPAEPQPGAPRAAWTSAVEDAERAQWTKEQEDSARMSLPSWFERLEFDGVRRARLDAAADPRWSVSADLRSATLTMSGVEEGEFVWIRVAAVPKEGAPAPKPAEREGDPFVPDWAKFAQRTSGWEYQLPAWKADALRRLREAPKADAGADAVPPAQAVPPATAPTAP
jgi:hypothetical protein